MRLINLNTDADIGANCWFVDLEQHRLLLDAGTHPKREGRAGLPSFSLVKGADLDAIVISHCHHDHIGALPLAMRQFPQAHVLLTELSYFLAERVLHNSVNVMTHQREELGIKEYPLYTHDELDELAPRFQGFKYNRSVEWAAFHKTRAGARSPTLEFYDAGHCLGSAGIMVRGQRETLFYSGDVCFHDQTIQRAARFEDVHADVLILETTRGGRGSSEGVSRQSEMLRLAEAIKRVAQRGGSILIPVFALGRTQEILAALALLMQEGKLRRQPVHIGGLGRVFTEIYDLEAHRTHRQHSNLILHEALELAVLEKRALQQIGLKGGRLFALTAGMLSEKTAAFEMAARMIEDPNQAIFFVGYTDPDTPGGRLRVAPLGERFLLSEKAGQLTRRCELLEFDFTAHAQREDLLDFVGRVSPRTVILGHGNEAARQWFEDQIRSRHPKMKVLQPGPGETVEI